MRDVLIQEIVLEENVFFKNFRKISLSQFMKMFHQFQLKKKTIMNGLNLKKKFHLLLKKNNIQLKNYNKNMMKALPEKKLQMPKMKKDKNSL